MKHLLILFIFYFYSTSSTYSTATTTTNTTIKGINITTTLNIAEDNQDNNDIDSLNKIIKLIKELYDLDDENFENKNIYNIIEEIFDKAQMINPKSLISFDQFAPAINEDTFRTPYQMILRQGYSLQIHKILTEDNYILTAWRINKNITKPYPVILNHGSMDSSFTWIVNNNSTQCLSYILCDMGYDVWLVNNRGNRYSDEYKYFTDKQNQSQYWAFSWDEMAKYDLPANINYILTKTNSSKLHFIAHSQGTLQMFARIAMDPSIQNYLQTFIGFGPMAFVNVDPSPFNKLIIKLGFDQALIDILQKHKPGGFLVSSKPYSIYPGYLCYYASWLCIDLIELICGKTNPTHLNISEIPVIASHEPGGNSYQNAAHEIQNIQSGEFQMYDYGSEELNIKAYGQPVPPLYNTSNFALFNTPSLMIQGTNDQLSLEKDFEKTYSYFNKSIMDWKIIPNYNHLDYIWSDTAYLDVYPLVIDFIKLHENS